MKILPLCRKKEVNSSWKKYKGFPSVDTHQGYALGRQIISQFLFLLRSLLPPEPSSISVAGLCRLIMDEAQTLARGLLQSAYLVVGLAHHAGLAKVQALERRLTEASEKLNVERLAKEEAGKKMGAALKSKESIEKSLAEVQRALAETRRKVEEDSKAAEARLARMREKALKHKRGEEESLHYWNQTHTGQFVNALHQFAILNPDLRVHGSPPDYLVKDGQIVRAGHPVDLESPNLPNPRQILVDESAFNKASVVLFDSEELEVFFFVYFSCVFFVRSFSRFCFVS
ncbi:hypothetical protein RIF29_19998 [Crotalaria pallida]|uniref:Uncharacterized protein n=1 Tax=Crotalaria pallida TaxID=3830 RepID=A0AAN9F0F9_CROPI